MKENDNSLHEWIETRISGYRQYLKDHPSESSVYNALISELETIKLIQGRFTPPQPKSVEEAALNHARRTDVMGSKTDATKFESFKAGAEWAQL